MKKTLAIILALVLTLGLASSALADDSWPTLRVEVLKAGRQSMHRSTSVILTRSTLNLLVMPAGAEKKA